MPLIKYLPIAILSLTDNFVDIGGSMLEGGNNLESSLIWLSFLLSICSPSFFTSLVSSGLDGLTSSLSTEFSLVISPRLELEEFSTFSIVLRSSSLSMLFSSARSSVIGFAVLSVLSSTILLQLMCFAFDGMFLSLSSFSILLVLPEFDFWLSVCSPAWCSYSFNLAIAFD